jgi:hypothetical protein
MRTKTLCTSCEQYVYTDADHSCHDAKALRAVRDAETAVLKKAEEWALVCNAHWADASWHSRCRVGDELTALVRALHAARRGGA